MTTANEYYNDFGFTAVDDPEELTPSAPPPPAPAPEDIYNPVIDRIQVLETNVELIIDTLSRLEQALTPNLDTEEYKQLIEKDVKERLVKVEGMVMPLLTNLLKDAETKEFIKWPNRRPIIEAFIEKLLLVTRS